MAVLTEEQTLLRDAAKAWVRDKSTVAALRSAFAPNTSQSFAAASVAVPQPGDSESTPGREAEPAHLRSIVGLVWRSVVLYMVLLALLTLANLIG